MRTCHACKTELDQSAITKGTCPKCGAIVLKLSQRTIEDKRLLRDPKTVEGLDDASLAILLSESIDIERAPSSAGGMTVNPIEVESETQGRASGSTNEPPPSDAETPVSDSRSAGTVDSADFPAEFAANVSGAVGTTIEPDDLADQMSGSGSGFVINTIDPPPLDELKPKSDRREMGTVDSIRLVEGADAGSVFNMNEESSPPAETGATTDNIPSLPAAPLQLHRINTLDDPKPATVPDRSDMTMDIPTSFDTVSPDELKQRLRRSTHTLESDRTVDLDFSADEARHLDSQWRGTFDLEAKQGQTIRQKETVSGYRSSLPVKSRYVREKRKAGAPPPQTLAEVPDYELLDIIGEGGMGVVYAAHQSSIARTVAVKMLKPSAKVREEQRDKFISEAVVTGELDHPNIVPIYDLGSNDEGALFYSMKRVRGTPWDKVIFTKQLDENLSILLRVADAVAFAHAGGVIHRDLKPENVMLGDYGEVLVMDWGLARITTQFAHHDAVYQSDSLGGTPAYMAPEMAKGPIETINKTSDIYLLGAILYEIIGGQPPHSGRDVMQCLMAASQNRIDAIRYDGELKEIALKAMSTHQEDRYQTVKEFQEAIRVYQSHSESLVLTAHANQNLQNARSSGDYQLYARALYGFQESLTLWDDNHRARMLLAETKCDYAKSALEKGDLDLAASLLDASDAEQQTLLEQVETARAERNARQRRLRLAKFAVAALLAAVVASISIGLVLVNAQRSKAVIAEREAVKQKDIAQVARKQAETDRDAAREAKAKEEIAHKEADERRIVAEKAQQNEKLARIDEEKQRIAAENAKKAEEYEAYVAQIGLASAKINDNAYDFASKLLVDSQEDLRNWEWGRLMHLSELSRGNFRTAGRVAAISFSPDGRQIAEGDLNGTVTIRDAHDGRKLYSTKHGQYVLTVAYSPNGRFLATGSSDGKIRILDASAAERNQNDPVVKTLEGHKDGILTVRFSPDGRRLLSGSYDHAARIWDVATGSTLQELKGHSWWVWAAEFSPDGRRIVTAGQDGKAIVWERPPELTGMYQQRTQFTGHEGAVYSARFSPDGKLVATGGYDNMVMVWDPEEVKPASIEAILKKIPEVKPNYMRLAGHSGPVRSVAFSPNGKLAISGSEDNTIRVWDVATGDAVKALRGHGSSVRSCVFSPDGNLVLSGGEDQSIRLWNVEGYQEVRVLRATPLIGNRQTKHEDAVLSARFSRDGKNIVTASRDRTAIMWDVKNGQPVRRFAEGHEFLVSGAVFFPDGAHLATGAGDNSVRIWDKAAGTEKRVLTNTGRIGTLAVSPDGKFLVTGSPSLKETENGPERNDIKVWEAHSGKLLGQLTGHGAAISALAFSPSGEQLASGDDRGEIRLWKVTPSTPGAFSWALERELLGHNGGITGLRYTPDGQRLITASSDHTCGQWHPATGEEARDLILKHGHPVTALDVSADGKWALTTCDDGLARLWRLADAAEVASIRSPGKPFGAASFSPDGSQALLTQPEDKLVQIWDLSAAAVASPAAGPAAPAQADLLRTFLNFNDLGGEVWAAMFAPGGRFVLTIGGNDAQLWDVDAKKPTVRYSPHGAVASAAVSPDGRLVATGSWDHSAKIWDASTGHAIRKLLNGHAGYINSVEFSPDGKELLTASDDGTARIWDVATGQPSGPVFKDHGARVFSAVYSREGDRVLTACEDKLARVFDRATGKLLFEMPGHKFGVLCGQFSTDGKIITGSQDNTAKVWDAEGHEIATLEGHSAAITAVAFSRDGKRALTGSRDNTAKLWDAANGKEILSLPGHTQEVTSVSFSPDGKDVLTSSRDGTAIIWLAKDWRGQKTVALRPQ
jgi:WD40 repeat protein/serine/threonine protein kinase